MGSIQLNTSKTDVYIKLTVLDKNVEVASTTGKGHAVLPAFIFYRDYDPNDPRPSSRACKYDHTKIRRCGMIANEIHFLNDARHTGRM